MKNNFLIIGISIFLLSFSMKAQSLSGILPKNLAYEYIQNPTFQWNELSGALDYTVILSQDPAFTSGLIQSSALVVSTWTSSSLAFGIWYWKINANTVQGIQSSSIYQFTIYTPTQNTNLSLWLKADENLTLDINGNVQTWTDLSPNSYAITQTDINKRPGVLPFSFNNLPSLSFNGSKFLNGGDILDIGTSSRSMFVVGKMGASNQTFFAKSIAAAGISRYALLKDGAQTAFLYNENVLNNIYSTFNTTNFGLYSLLSNRVTAKNKFTVNNTQLGIANINSSYNFNSTFRFLIGAYSNATDDGELLFLNGNISEIVFINSADTAEVSSVQNYLRYKYSPPINLGKDTTTNHFCPINLTAPTGFTNLLWSTGETTSSISVNQAGQYWVQGTDLFGYVSSDTIQINHPVIQTPNTNICVNESRIWDTGLSTGFTFLWSTAETTPSISITTPGTYSVQVTDAFMCTKNSGPVTFTIDTYSQTAYLGNDTSLCSGNFIALQIGAAETVSYTWPDASTLAQYTVDTTGNYFVESTNGNGCVAQDTIQITITGTAPTAAFSYTNVCLNTISTFTDQSIPVGLDNIAIWNWNMGDGSPILTSQNPSYTYAATGTYTVQLYVESAGGCGAYRSSQVQVFANPTSNFSFAGHCAGQPVQFTNTSTNGSTPITTYLWNFDMPLTGSYNTSTIPVPNRIFADPGTYNVSFQVTDGNSCTNTIILPVVIDPSPVASFTYTDACVNAAIQFTNTSVTDPFSTYYWDFGNGTNSILQNPSKSFPSFGTYTVSLQVTNPSACSSTILHPVQVFPNPVPVMDLSPYCMDTYMEVNDLSTIVQGSIDSSVWVFNTTNTQSGSPVSFLIPSLGQQQIQLTTYSDEGCFATISQFIDVTTALNVSFTAPSVVAAGEPLDFVNTSTGTSIALWNFGDGQFSSVFNPTHIYGTSFIDSTVEVYLISLNTQGCRDTAYHNVTIQQAKLDLELSQVYLQKQGAWYIVGVKMINRGSVTIASADLNIETQNGILFTETWNGTLLPLQNYIYVFNAQVNAAISYEDESEAFICVNGIGYNLANVAETKLDNNTACRNIEGENVILVPIYPNPVSETMTVQLIVTVASEVSLDLFDFRGRVIKNILPTQELAVGTHIYTVNVDQLAEGEYFVRMKSGGNSVMQKVLVTSDN